MRIVTFKHCKEITFNSYRQGAFTAKKKKKKIFFFLFLPVSIFFLVLIEALHQGTSKEFTQHMFLLRNGNKCGYPLLSGAMTVDSDIKPFIKQT